RLGVETITRCVCTARLATKCLRPFISRPATPASPAPDKTAIFPRPVIQGWGQVQNNWDSGSRWMKVGEHISHPPQADMLSSGRDYAFLSIPRLSRSF